MCQKGQNKLLKNDDSNELQESRAQFRHCLACNTAYTLHTSLFVHSREHLTKKKGHQKIRKYPRAW